MSKKLCKVVDGGITNEKQEKFIKMVNKAKYYCDKCGRLAKKDKNLCKPKDLTPEK